MLHSPEKILNFSLGFVVQFNQRFGYNYQLKQTKI